MRRFIRQAFPLQINDGRVHYDGENIDLVNVGGTLGISSFSDLTARISLGKDAWISVQVVDANLCGISCPGVLNVTPQDISLDFQLLSHFGCWKKIAEYYKACTENTGKNNKAGNSRQEKKQ